MKKRKKRRLKKWVLYFNFIVIFTTILLLSSKYGLIVAFNNEMGLTSRGLKIIILLIIWEILKATIKAIFKREEEEGEE